MSKPKLHDSIAEAEYLRQRSDPRPGDGNYLILSDLLLALSAMIDNKPQKVLDYGCGGMPYKSLFNGSYTGADSIENSSADMHLNEDGTVPAEDNSFDFILSTQVLEHVDSPALYLSECRRLLADNGTLLITTHGSYQDHPCPKDLWRWTTDGLLLDIERAGFVVGRAVTITNGPRTALHMLERELPNLSSLRRNPSIFAILFRLFGKIPRKTLHHFADKKFNDQRIIDKSENRSARYVGIAVSAKRA